VEISLTAVGVKSAGQVRRAFAAVEDEALAGVSPTAVNQARRVLTALAAI
jgi:hypothetical protein